VAALDGFFSPCCQPHAGSYWASFFGQGTDVLYSAGMLVCFGKVLGEFVLPRWPLDFLRLRKLGIHNLSVSMSDFEQEIANFETFR
jgi:hypothetical protein